MQDFCQVENWKGVIKLHVNVKVTRGFRPQGKKAHVFFDKITEDIKKVEVVEAVLFNTIDHKTKEK